MPIPLDAPAILEREFLSVRAKIIEIAAALDRLDRADGSVVGDPRVTRILEGLAAIAEPTAERAEKIQMIFSLPYDKQWRRTFGLDGSAEG